MLRRDLKFSVLLLVALGLPVAVCPVLAADQLAADESPASKTPAVKESKGDKSAPKEKEAGKTGDAEKRDAEKRDAEKKPGPLPVTPEREVKALAFVQQHHPELVQLLTYLKENQPKEYLRAIRELFRVQDRLAMIKDRDSELHELELKAWKLRSRVQLISARVRMTPQDDGLKQQLKRTLAEQIEVRRTLVGLEIQRVRNRLEKLENQARELNRDKTQLVDRQFRERTSTRPKAGSKGREKVKEAKEKE